MVVIRPTRKLQTALPVSPPPHRSDTALGDWYVNRLVADRQPLLLLVSAASLLPIIVRARNVRTLPEQIGGLVANRLRRLNVDTPLIEAERRAMMEVRVGVTIERSVLGIMVDFAKAVPFLLRPGWEDGALETVEDGLALTPCHAGKASHKVVFPDRKTHELLTAKWT